MPEEEFYTLWYIDSRRPSDLQFGSPSRRMEFFTALFRLDNFDSVRKLFNSLATNAKKDKILFTRLKDELIAHKADILDTNLLAIELAKTQSELESVNTKLNKIQKEIVQQSDIANLKDDFYTLRNLSKDLGIQFNKKDLQSALNNYEVEVENADELKDQIADYKVYKQLSVSYEEKLEKIKPYLSLATKEEIESWQENFQLVEKLTEELTTISKTLKDLMQGISDNYKQNVSKFKDTDFQGKLEKQTNKYAELRSTKSRIEKDISSISNHNEHEKVCPTCNQKIKSTKEIQKLLENSLKEVNVSIRACKEKLTRMNQIVSDINIDTEAKELEEKKSKLGFKLLTLKKTLNLSKITESNANKIARAYVYKENLTRPKPVDKPIIPKQLNEKIKFVLLASRTLQYFDALDSNTNQKDLSKIFTKLKNSQQGLNSKIVDLSTKIELSNKATEKANQIRAELKTYKKSIEDLPIIEDLIEAYSNKGIKLLIIQRIAKFIEENMNKYANLLYFEPVKFAFTVNETEFKIEFTRKYKNETRTADVRSLSGAESRAFTFLFPLAIMPLIPARRRLNVMVLDEPTVNMDDTMRDLFINSFIPKLNTLIPHVIIVTPLTEHYKNSREFFVVKKDGKSNLVPSNKIEKYFVPITQAKPNSKRQT